MNEIDTEKLGRRIIAHPLVLLFIALVMVVGSVIGFSIIGNLIHQRVGDSDGLGLILSVSGALVATLAYWLFVRFVERKPFSDFAGPGKLAEWGAGIGIGAGAMALTIAVIGLFGGYLITGTNPVAVLVPVLGMAIFSGVWEEIFIRGILFRFLEQWLGSWVALIFSAAFFGFAHIANDNATILSSVAIALEAGILLAAIYMLTRRLWAAIGLHMAWNFTQGGIFGVAVSGGEMRGLLSNQMPGSELLTGGAFGAEASIPAMVICTSIGLICLVLAWRHGRFVSMSWHRLKTGQAVKTDQA